MALPTGEPNKASEASATADAAADATGRLEKIADHVPGLLYQFILPPDSGGHGRFRYVSKRAEQWFGVPASRVLEDPAHIFGAIDPRDITAMWQSFHESAKGLDEWRQEFRIRRADGQWRWILGRSTPQREADGTVLWHGYLEDVTERRELEQARHDTAVAEAANRAKTEFLSRISHELRTPLNAVLGFTQLLEMDHVEPPTEGQRRRLKLIHDAGDHLLRMIGDLLDLTRIESGSLPLDLEAVALQTLVQEVFAMLQETAARAQVTLEWVSLESRSIVRADRTRLCQVLLNLVSNAIKYNRRGGTVQLEVQSAEAGLVLLQVRDTGVGIADVDRGKLFEPFHRGRHAHGKIEGTGIGLSLTRSLVQLMHGELVLAETSEQGSVFRLRLPAA